MKTIYLNLLLCLGLIQTAAAFNSLRVADPQNPWYNYQGTIEEATLSVKPKGIYMEYGLYLTFSARNTPLNGSNDSLEVVFSFDLPANALVADSWLWLEDTIARAKMFDVWTATSVYEGIVNRRRDPSLLKKLSATQYELRVFPMKGNGDRKVKITFLLPTTWDDTRVSSKLPLNLLTTSYNPLAQLELVTLTDSTWKNPAIKTYPSFVFNQYNSPDFGDYKHTVVPNSYFWTDLNIAFTSPMNNGVFLSTYSDASDNYYQLVISPKVLLNNTVARKMAYLVDYDNSRTSYSQAAVLSALKQSIHDNLSPTDSFNLIFSGFMINRVSNTWIPADSQTVENIFAVLSNPMANYSNLQPLIANGIDFVVNNGNDGKIMLMSCSDQYGSSSAANSLINDIVGSMNPDIPFYITDYQTQNYSYNWINGQYQYGNQYFYSTLTGITQGAYYRTLFTGYSLGDVLQMNSNEAGGIISSLNLYTSLASGYCFGRYTINGDQSTAYLNRPIQQVGKFNGTGAFSVSISGEYGSMIYNNNLSFSGSQIVAGDSVSKATWAGMYIKDLEAQPATNNIINNIVNKSMATRVLSRYTALLCLEDSTYFCSTCPDETQLISLDELSANDSILQVAPNPFAESVTITLNKKDGIDYSDAIYKIYNLLGEEVYTFSFAEADNGETMKFVWNGSKADGSFVASGMYMFVMKSADGVKRVKLIKS